MRLEPLIAKLFYIDERGEGRDKVYSTGILIGGLDFTGLKIQVGTATITYGNFIQNVVDFLIVAACIFAMLKF